MESLSKKVKDGTIKEAGEAKAAFAKAEMAVAHSYMVISQKYIENAPKKAKAKIREAVQKIENATSLLEGDAKTDARTLMEEIRVNLAKGDQRTNEIGDHLGEQVIKMKNWIERHASEKGGQLPPQNPSE